MNTELRDKIVAEAVEEIRNQEICKFRSVTEIVTQAVRKAEMGVLREAAGRECSVCREKLKVRKYGTIWRHAQNEECGAQGVRDMIAEIEKET